MSPHKIALGMVTGNSTCHLGVVASMVDIINNGNGRFELTPLFVNSIYVCRNRNFVGASFLGVTDCDYLLMLDADNGITTEGLSFFMEDFEDPEVNIVSGKYFHKGGKNGLWVAGFSPPEVSIHYHQSIPEGSFSKDLINITKELGTAIVGAGCLMVRRRVLEEVEYPWFKSDWEKLDKGGNLFVGEDLYFSYLVQEHGFDIHLDQRIKSPHYAGEMCYPKEWDMTDIWTNAKKKDPDLQNQEFDEKCLTQIRRT